MKKSRMLKTLKVGGLNYKIHYPYVFETNAALLGLHEGDQCRIKISKLFMNLERKWPKIVETLLHEVVHAIDTVYCGNVMLEDEVSVISSWLYMILRDNELNIKKDKLPETVRIGGMEYNVLPYTFNDDCSSACTVEHETLKFLIGEHDSNGNPYHDGLKMSNFVYLVVCCICEASTIPRGFTHGAKMDNGVESQQTFANGLYQVLKDSELEKLIKSDGELK